MKKYIYILMFLTLQLNFAQNTYPFPENNNVGIGTVNPLSKLDVVGTAKFRETNSSYYSELSSDVNNAYLRSYGVANSLLIYDILGKPIVMQPYMGNVGIGTLNPQQKFVVSNNNKEGFEVYLDPASSVVGLQSYDRSLGTHSKMQLDASQFSFMYGSVGIGTLNPQQKFVVSNNNKEGFEVYLDPTVSVVGLQSYNRSLSTYSKMQLDASQFSFMYGKVGIGILNPTNELDVNGTVHSKEVKVDMKDWSDFVFKKEYILPTLEQVEKHISEKGHLENIPSEEEVLKNGINLGEMNAKLLQKIEELTLYIIEQDKKTEQLKTIISDQNKRLEKLESKR